MFAGMRGMRNHGKEIIVVPALVAATLAVYGQVAGNGFVNIDDDHATENPHVRAGFCRGFSCRFNNVAALIRGLSEEA